MHNLKMFCTGTNNPLVSEFGRGWELIVLLFSNGGRMPLPARQTIFFYKREGSKLDIDEFDRETLCKTKGEGHDGQ